MDIVTADIGGTHARFAIATLDPGRVAALSEPVTLRTADYASLKDAWIAFGAAVDRPLPNRACLALATAITGRAVKLTNNAWIIDPACLNDALGLVDHLLVNDFGAVAHAVALNEPSLIHLAGPDRTLRATGAVSVIGPGTGLGAAQLVFDAQGDHHVIPTEGGHMGFAPRQPFDFALIQALGTRFGRVSAERATAGPALALIAAVVAEESGTAAPDLPDRDLWALALARTDPTVTVAFDHYARLLGTVAGDLVLAQGAHGLVLAGGLGQRIAPAMIAHGFMDGFVDKGRFRALLADMPVKLIPEAQPGLLGAASAYVQRLRRGAAA